MEELWKCPVWKGKSHLHMGHADAVCTSMQISRGSCKNLSSGATLRQKPGTVVVYFNGTMDPR